jgi:hypothetical protein
MLEWIGGELEPEAFDLDEINVELQRLTQSEVRRRPRYLCGPHLWWTRRGLWVVRKIGLTPRQDQM